ncbi:MAG TPA: hypothetical protein VIT68_01325 [Candidatus Gracilibacteria bacterium]
MSEILGSRDLEVAGAALEETFLKQLVAFQDADDVDQWKAVEVLSMKGILNLRLLLVKAQESIDFRPHDEKALWQWLHDKIPDLVQKSVSVEHTSTLISFGLYTAMMQMVSYAVINVLGAQIPQLRPTLAYSFLLGIMGTFKLMKEEGRRLKRRRAFLNAQVEHYQRVVAWELEED